MTADHLDMDVFCEPGPDQAHAVLITFPDGMSKEKCDDILRRMFKAGYCKAGDHGTAPTCRTFNPDQGSPVFYIP